MSRIPALLGLSQWNGSLDAFIARFVEPTEENTEEIRQDVGFMASFLTKRSGSNVARVYEAGSMRKETNVRGFSDIDLVVFLNDFDSMEEFIANLPTILDKLERNIKRWRGNRRWKMAVERETHHGIKVRLTDDVLGETVHVDILPTIDNLTRPASGWLFCRNPFASPISGTKQTYAEMDAVSERDRGFYSSSLTELQCKWVMDRISDEQRIKDLIRLVKYWKKTELTLIDLPSYLLEILVIRTWENVHPGNYPPSEFSMEKAFKRILRELVNYDKINFGYNNYYNLKDYVNAAKRQPGKPFILDPANPFNNVCSRCTSWRAVSDAAKRTCDIPQLRNVASNGRWDN